MQDTSEDHTECEARVMYRASTDALLKLLVQHHDFNMKTPRGWKKPLKRIEFTPQPPSAEFKELWLGFDSEETRPPKRELSIEDIKRAVCRYFDLTNVQIVSNRRSLETVRPRQMVAYFARNMTPKSLPEIGRRLGGRDHTTIMSACRRIEALMKTDLGVAYDVAQLEMKLDEASSYAPSHQSYPASRSVSQSGSLEGADCVGAKALHSPR